MMQRSASAPPAATWPWRRALAWLAFLGPFFFLTYGIANWLAAQRVEVPSVTFGWERAIPFWAWTILPYWSIDLLYGISLFVCRSPRELDTHAKRLLTAQVIAIACFIVVPLRFSFEHPAVDGAWGWLFAALGSFDKPFNQLPSLHIALAVILWSLYARKLKGVARLTVDAGFVLIGASVLTTFQHHFIDIPTGLLLGALCVWAWPFADEGDGRSLAGPWQWTHDPARRRLAAIYAFGGALLVAIAVAVGGWAWWLLWPAVSLVLVALAYAALGERAFQKDPRGRLSIAARCLFAPYLAGVWVNSRAWTAREKNPVAIVGDVYLGRVPTTREFAGSSFASLVDLTAEMHVRARPGALEVIPVLDLTIPTSDQLMQAAEAIDRLRAEGRVWVCCALGRSRSACAVAAWLLASGRARDVEAALATIRAARAIVIDDRHIAALDGVVASTPTRLHAAVAG